MCKICLHFSFSIRPLMRPEELLGHRHLLGTRLLQRSVQACQARACHLLGHICDICVCTLDQALHMTLGVPRQVSLSCPLHVRCVPTSPTASPTLLANLVQVIVRQRRKRGFLQRKWLHFGHASEARLKPVTLAGRHQRRPSPRRPSRSRICARHPTFVCHGISSLGL